MTHDEALALIIGARVRMVRGRFRAGERGRVTAKRVEMDLSSGLRVLFWVAWDQSAVHDGLYTPDCLELAAEAPGAKSAPADPAPKPKLTTAHLTPEQAKMLPTGTIVRTTKSCGFDARSPGYYQNGELGVVTAIATNRTANGEKVTVTVMLDGSCVSFTDLAALAVAVRDGLVL